MQVLLFAHAARAIRRVDLSHAELMSGVYGWPDPASPKLAGYAVAHASMARSLTRLEARGLIRRTRGEGVSVVLTRRGRTDAIRLLRELPVAELPHVVHEAGHTVVAFALGLRVTGMHVGVLYDPHAGSTGSTFVLDGLGDRKTIARRAILVAWGGACAEHVMLQASIDERIMYASARTDFQDMTSIATADRISARQVAELREQAIGIIREHEEHLARLVEALQTYRMIGGTDARAIFDCDPGAG